MSDVLLALGVLLLVACAVLAWPPPTRVQAPPASTGHLIAALRDYVARRG